MKTLARRQFVTAVALRELLVPNRGRGVIPSASVFSSPSVRDNGNFAEGYRLPTASPYQKARRDINQAPVKSSRSDPRFSEMRSFAGCEVSQATSTRAEHIAERENRHEDFYDGWLNTYYEARRELVGAAEVKEPMS